MILVTPTHIYSAFDKINVAKNILLKVVFESLAQNWPISHNSFNLLSQKVGLQQKESGKRIWLISKLLNLQPTLALNEDNEF